MSSRRQGPRILVASVVAVLAALTCVAWPRHDEPSPPGRVDLPSPRPTPLQDAPLARSTAAPVESAATADVVMDAEVEEEDDEDEEDAVLPGRRALLARDATPFVGQVRLVELDASGHPTGRERVEPCDERGGFLLDGLEAGWWSLALGPEWPAGVTFSASHVVAFSGVRVHGALKAGLVLCVLPARQAGLPDALAGHVVVELPEDDVAVAIQAFTPQRVRGRVVDVGGTPVADAELHAVHGSADGAWPLGRAGADGAFEVDVPRRGSVTGLVATARGRSPGGVDLSQKLGQGTYDTRRPSIAVDAGDLVLGDASIPVRGVVRDVDGAAVPGARVRTVVPLVEQYLVPWVIEVRTDADGGFEVELPATSSGGWSTELSVHASHPAFELPAEERVLAWPGGPPLELVLERACRVEGRVVGPDGRPVEGAHVEGPWLPSSVTSDADGRFFLERAPERLDLRVSLPRAHLEPPTLEPCVQLLATLASREASLEVRLEVGPATVEGFVRRRDGAPSSRASSRAVWYVQAPEWPVLWPPRGASRTALTPEASAVPDAEGRFVLPGLPAGARVVVGGGAREVETVAGARDLVVEAADGLEGFREVRLRIVEAETGRPLAGRVRFGPWGNDVVTLESGLRASVVQEHAALVVDAPGRVPRELALPFGPEALDLGDVALARAGSVAVTVLWPRVPAILLARWRDPDGREREVSGAGRAGLAHRSGSGGPWTIEGLAPGPVALELVAHTPGGDVRVVVEVTVRAGEVVPVTADLLAALEAAR